MFQSLVKPICTKVLFNNEINPNNIEEDDLFEDYIDKCMPNIYIYVFLIYRVWTLTL